MIKYFLLNLKTTYFRLFEWARVVLCYYPKEPKFALLDLLLACHYLWKSPHRLSKHFLMKRKEREIYTYGETPLTSLDHIAKQSRITSKDVVYELGCGPGRTCFWLASFVKCQVVGIDYLPEFIHKANAVKNRAALHNARFLQEDMLLVDLKKATVIYLYGICLEEAVIEKLIARFTLLNSSVTIITVSFPLSDYSSQFKIAKEFTIRFPWGKASLFLNEKTY